ncbi:MAG: dienelactone hydrolase family protein [Sphingomicrobium sp.]
MTDTIRQQAIALYNQFTHEGMNRRDFMARMTAIAGSAAAAELLVATIAASPAAAAIVVPDDKRLVTSRGPLGFGSKYSGYVAATRGVAKRGVVLVIHENRGLNAHIEDVARRLALAGFIAVAPDQLSAQGGTPADEDKARDMIGKVDLAEAVADTVMLGAALKKGLKHSNGKLGIVGFCWGGAFVNRVAVAAGKTLDAGVSYYGPAPDPAEAAKVEAPLTIHLAGLDDRVAKTAFPWIDALRKADKNVTYFGYDGVNHAFNNDTSAERYNKPAADLAWRRTLRFFRKYLG